jgi:hypothetical protein
VDGVLDAAQIGDAGGIASLVRRPEDREPRPALRRHFRHERHFVEPAIGVQRRKDLFLGADLHPFTGLEAQSLFVAHRGPFPKKIQ